MGAAPPELLAVPPAALPPLAPGLPTEIAGCPALLLDAPAAPDEGAGPPSDWALHAARDESVNATAETITGARISGLQMAQREGPNGVATQPRLSSDASLVVGHFFSF